MAVDVCLPVRDALNVVVVLQQLIDTARLQMWWCFKNKGILPVFHSQNVVRICGAWRVVTVVACSFLGHHDLGSGLAS